MSSQFDFIVFEVSGYALKKKFIYEISKVSFKFDFYDLINKISLEFFYYKENFHKASPETINIKMY